MYSPTRMKLGPKPASAAPRSPMMTRSPSVPSGPSFGSASPYRGGSPAASSFASNTAGQGSPLAARYGVTPLKASSLSMGRSGSTTTTPTTTDVNGLSGGSPTNASSSPTLFTRASPPSSPTASSSTRIQSVMQGGAVGLWRVARDGHSPMGSAATSGDGRDGVTTSETQQRPATQGSPTTGRLGMTVPSPSNRFGVASSPTRGNANDNGESSAAEDEGPAQVSIDNNTSAPLLNMSLDAALMGGLLRESNPHARLRGPAASNEAPAPKVGTAFGARRNTTTLSSSSTTRSLSANASSNAKQHARDHLVLQQQTHSYLIPSLKLPVYTRKGEPPYALLDAFEEAGGSTGGGEGGTTSTIQARPAWVTVVFDLDETLCNNRLPGKAMLRPGCMELLHALVAIRDNPSANCFVEIVLWTASMECVARPVLERMDPHDTVFDHLIFRDRRWYKENGYTKDLRLLGRDLSHVVIIENSPMSVVLNRKHAILTKDFVGGGSVNYYYGGGPLNTRTSTGSLSDPTLFIVKRVLCDWCAAVGAQALEALGKRSSGEGDIDINNNSSRHDPAFVALPVPLGIVEFLRDSPDITPNNEVVLSPPAGSTTSPQRSIGATGGGSLCGSPARSLGRAGGGLGLATSSRVSPWASSTTMSYRTTSAAPPTRRYR